MVDGVAIQTHEARDSGRGTIGALWISEERMKPFDMDHVGTVCGGERGLCLTSSLHDLFRC